MKKIFFGILLSIILICNLTYLKNISRENFVELNYIVTNNGMPDSFDPLDGDKSLNLSSMRMLYATPIEISKDNILISNVLDDFEYTTKTKTITFKVKSNIKFSDDTPLVPRDIAITIARMAYFRPTFPIIKDILGLDEWILKKEGLINLPRGIKVVGQNIEIQLTKSSLNPLFRFCLELFSIIPEKCIDLKTGKMQCPIAPSSGYFTIKKMNDKKIVFTKRQYLQNIPESIPYQTINFIFKSLETACNEKIEANTIITGTELGLINSKCSTKIKPSQIHWTPAARFNSLVFNPTSSPFNTRGGRQYFAEKVREDIKAKFPNLIVERSLFSQLLPGYIPSEKFTESVPDRSIINEFKGKKLALIKKAGDSNIIRESIENVARLLSMEIVYLKDTSNEALDNAFLNDKLQVDTFNSGFWAQDPVGDLSMLFTPNLHIALSFNWKDIDLTKQITAIENETDPQLVRSKMEDLNKLINNNSLLAPIAHFRRIFITSSSISSLNLPQAVTSPAPWQLIPIK
ncbi:MAG: hypothetical protein Q7U04_13110 [Bacteriovorax sp.]|nr:hypothetical protein [Bacteriovorax sp.]